MTLSVHIAFEVQVLFTRFPSIVPEVEERVVPSHV